MTENTFMFSVFEIRCNIILPSLVDGKLGCIRLLRFITSNVGLYAFIFSSIHATDLAHVTFCLIILTHRIKQRSL
jgi:hypothetical protein